ncbi:MAG TPA: S9 family peptidase, partial [Caulobacteraceae bacterium]
RPAIMVMTWLHPDGAPDVLTRPVEIADDWDRAANAIGWSADGRSLLALAADHAQVRLFSIDVRSGAVRPLTGDGTVSAWEVAGDRIVYLRDDATGPAQLYSIPASGGAERRLTDHNAALLATIEMGAYEPFTFTGWNGEEVQGYVYKPAGYVEGRRYPVAHLIHGGPKSPFTNTFGYRWNPQVYAGAGYGVVWINFHGSPGYSQAFTDSINSHWGDRPLEDLQKGWAAALAANPWLDERRACALGASYGGYMVNWMASQWNGPWRCLVNHAGVFDVPQMMGAMDISWFVSEFGGHPSQVPQTYAAFNPGDHINRWTRPMLVIHGGRDFRVPLEQSLRTFNALQFRGLPSRFVYAPDENHWILKPRNSVRWQEEILGWLDEWTGAAAP